ncbi:MAG: hypothetical protein OH337_03825 [Candidatus Parvarchaeota archaeon]|nr:hypothetical protein [Candidatus Haiyanarchaeum thermophilum]
MATAAKKHLTLFIRKRTAPNAGRKEVKDAFREIAHLTLGEPERSKRNTTIKIEMEKRGLRTNVYKRKSRARPGSDLYGFEYIITFPKEVKVVKPPTSFVTKENLERLEKWKAEKKAR